MVGDFAGQLELWLLWAGGPGVFHTVETYSFRRAVGEMDADQGIPVFCVHRAHWQVAEAEVDANRGVSGSWHKGYHEEVVGSEAGYRLGGPGALCQDSWVGS